MIKVTQTFFFFSCKILPLVLKSERTSTLSFSFIDLHKIPFPFPASKYFVFSFDYIVLLTFFDPLLYPNHDLKFILLRASKRYLYLFPSFVKTGPCSNSFLRFAFRRLLAFSETKYLIAPRKKSLCLSVSLPTRLDLICLVFQKSANEE